MKPARPDRAASARPAAGAGISPVYRPKKPVSRSLRLLLLLLLATSIAWLAFTRNPQVREYRLYLFQQRIAVTLPLSELSEGLTEGALRERYGAWVRCGSSEAVIPLPNVRQCALDTHAFNGVPALYINFFFARDHLVKVAVAIPWWRHAAGLNHVQASYGPPVATQDQRLGGVRLHAWKLENGAAIVYNRDMPYSPFGVNSIQWMTSAACGGRPCVR